MRLYENIIDFTKPLFICRTMPLRMWHYNFLLEYLMTFLEGTSWRPTMGEVSRLRLSPSESRFTRLLLVTLLWGPPGPCCSSPAGHTDLSAGLRPFQSTALWEEENEENEEKGQPRLSSAVSKPPSPPSPPGLSSPQSEPTELLNDSEEILRDDEDMVVARKRRRRVVMMMMKVVVLRMMVMLQSVPYHVHLYAGESSDSGG